MCGGRSPCRPNSVRSSSVNAVPLFRPCRFRRSIPPGISERFGDVLGRAVTICVSFASFQLIVLAEQIDSREVDDFVTAPVENSLQHEEAEAFRLFVRDSWRHGEFLPRDRDLDQCRAVVFESLRDNRFYLFGSFRLQTEKTRPLCNLCEVRIT